MLFAARRDRSRVLLAVPALAVALALTACGGGSGAGSGTTTSSAAAGMSSSSSGMSGGSMPGMSSGQSMPSTTSYPPVTPGAAATGAHNAADVAFATGMISHHGQAVVMSDLLLARSSDSQVKALAQRIKQAQTPEIAAMAGWLKGWGAKVPDPYATMDDQMAGMGQDGMMSKEQMGQLESAMGTAADKSFLMLMPEHHRGAIAMARTELAKGANPEAKKLARSIITSQSAEITEMKAMLAKLR